MKLFGLVWANLFRKRTRTFLTLLSLIVAFLLFMLLRSVAGAFDDSFTVVGADRLVTSPKYSITDSLPISQRQQILSIEGVDAVTHSQWFGGEYQDSTNFFPKYPVTPRSYFEMYPEYVIDPEVLESFASKRTATVVQAGLAEKFAWKVGDIIPIQADIWPKEDGSINWEFELVGTFSGEENVPPLMLFQHEYFTESVADYGKNQIGWWTVRLTDSNLAAEVALAIDRRFENSLNPTKTSTEDEYSRQFARQIGDIGFIATIIMSAVFFTILLLTGNTMAQALRERVPELAVLKTLGFTDSVVSALVLAESVLLCVVGGILGIVLSAFVFQIIGPAMEGVLGRLSIDVDSVVTVLGMAVVLGLIVGGVPAYQARNLTIVNALRQR
jgi:putative ABC transport system permease protein